MAIVDDDDDDDVPKKEGGTAWFLLPFLVVISQCVPSFSLSCCLRLGFHVVKDSC